MELRIANEVFEPYHLIDEFESCIWTDRYSGYGDFKLKVKRLTQLTGGLHVFPRYLMSSVSGSIMMVETVETKRQEDGERVIEVAGRSLEAFLENRTNTSPNGSPITNTDTIPNMVKTVLNRAIFEHANPAHNLPGLELGYFAPGPVITWSYDRGDLYSVIKGLCDEFGYGFSIYRSFYNGVAGIQISVVDGLDRTDPESSIYMEYSQDMDNLTDLSSLTTIAGFKNHARVEGPRYILDVFDPRVPYTPEGFRRRTMVVDASNVGTDPDVPVSEDIPILRALGLKALREQSPTRIIDGTIPPAEWNKIYYGLGDKVVVKDSDGIRRKVRITEQIFASDATGDKRTPSFTTLPGEL